MRVPVRLVAAVLGGLLLTAVTAGPGAAATAYRYWAYWHWSGSGWSYATTGPGGYVPDDGAVEGWRMAVSAEGAPVSPRDGGDFAGICGGTPRADGSKRVALVLDFGVAGDAAPGETPPRSRSECVVVPTGARASVVLTAAVRVRANSSGLVCALDGYPSKGCGEAVPAGKARPTPSVKASAGPTPPAKASSSPSASSTPSRSTPRASATASRPRPSASSAHPTTSSASASASTPTASSASSPPGRTSTPSGATAAAAAVTPPSEDAVPEASTSPSAGAAPLAAGQADDDGPTVPTSLIIGLLIVALIVAAAAFRATRRGPGP